MKPSRTATVLLATTLLLTAPLALAQAPPAAGGASELTLPALLQRPDLWPARVTVHRELSFAGGGTVHAGQEVALADYQDGTLVCQTDGFLFGVDAADTDLLERGRAIAAALTPEQLALTAQTLAGRSELWPVHVTLRTDVDLMDDSSYPAGTELALRTIEKGQLNVSAGPQGTFFTLDPKSTDVVARARQRLALPADQREPFFVRSLEAALGAKEGEHPLAGARTVLVYTGRIGCSRCAAFLPELKAFYARAKAKHPDFEVVFVSADFNADDARHYEAEGGIPGLLVPYERRFEAATCATLTCRLLPGLFLLDRNGKLLEQNDPDGRAPTALDVLQRFESRLDQEPAPSTPAGDAAQGD